MALFAGKDPACFSLVLKKQEWVLIEQIKCCMEPFYNYILISSNNTSLLPMYLSMLWGIIDILDTVSSGELPYNNIDPELRQAFNKAKETLQSRVDKVGNLNIYFAAHALNSQIKFILIREKYSDDAQELIDRAIDYLKCHYPQSPVNPTSNEELIPDLGMSSYEWALLQCSANLSVVPQQANDFDRFFAEPIVLVQPGQKTDFILE